MEQESCIEFIYDHYFKIHQKKLKKFA